MNDPSALRDIEKSISRVTKFYDTSIKTMHKLRDTMRQQKNSLSQLRSSGVTNRIELVKKIRSEIEATLGKLRQQLEASQEVQPA